MTTGPKKPLDADAVGADEGFVARWSKRKHAVRQGLEIEPPPAPADHALAKDDAAVPAPVLTDKDMPPIESLTADSDVSGFFSPGVSEELRRLALRKLFHMPEFNTRCPLDSEWYDCTKLTDLGSIITHDMREAMEREAKELAGKALDEALGPEEAAPTEAPRAGDNVVAEGEAGAGPSQSNDGAKQ